MTRPVDFCAAMNSRVIPPNSACVFCNGPLASPRAALKCAQSARLRIAADGGGRHMKKLGIRPDIVIGDMDSGGRLWRKDTAVRFVRFPANKDKTDAELAVEQAFAEGCAHAVLLAATGGRLDHTLGNVALAARYPGRVTIVDGSAFLRAADSDHACHIHGLPGLQVSIIPLGGEQARITTAGLKYALRKKCLAFATHGISNMMKRRRAGVSVSGGIVLVAWESAGL